VPGIRIRYPAKNQYPSIPSIRTSLTWKTYASYN